MNKRFLMAMPLLFSLLAGCIIILPPPNSIAPPDVLLAGVTPCQNTPMPSLISCVASTPFSNPITYFDQVTKTLPKVNAFVDILLEIGVKVRRFFDLFRGDHDN